MSAKARDFPSIAIITADEAVGPRIGEFQLFGVPIEPLTGDTIGHGADQHCLGQRTAVRELVACLAIQLCDARALRGVGDDEEVIAPDVPAVRR